MNKKIVASIIVGGVCIGSIQLSPTFASNDNPSSIEANRMELRDTLSTGNYKQSQENLRSRGDSKLRDEKSLQFSKKYGISIEGKSMEEIQNELIKYKAEELGISVEGKNIDAIRFAILVEEAKKVGISINGKDEKTLAEELNQALKAAKPNSVQNLDLQERKQDPRFLPFLKENGISTDEKNLAEIQYEVFVAKAKELGIDTDGKSLEAIQQELRSTLLLQKAKELGISTQGKNESTLIKELQEAEKNKKEQEKKERR